MTEYEDKQIEEMALALSEGSCGKECDCTQNDKFNCHLLHNATVLYNAGYRKQSEVVKEIFEMIEKCMEHDYISSVGVYNGTLGLRIAELKKKYTEE